MDKKNKIIKHNYKKLKQKNNNIKYDFSNPESQKLFEEFTLLLADITKYLESREMYIQNLEYKLSKKTPIRHLLKSSSFYFMEVLYRVLKKTGLFYHVKKILDKVPLFESLIKKNFRDKLRTK